MKIIIAPLFLALFGLFNLLGINQDLFFRQLTFVIIAFIGFFIVKKIGNHFFKANAKVFYWIMVATLIITFIIGIEVKGSKRWLDLYFFNFQGSEFFKLFFLFYLSEFLAEKRILENDLVFFIKSLLIFIPPVFIIFKQPDLGNASVFIFIYIMMIIFSKIPKKIIFLFIATLTALMPFGWFFLKNYQKDRIISFFNPNLDTQGIAYNMIQSVITIGSGKFFGRGLGLGTQSRLFFLPENTTDFAFASLVEQFGFLGGFFVIFFYALMIYFVSVRAIKYFFMNDKEGQTKFLFSIGILAYLVFQVFVNIGMNMGVLPVAGVALPFISYGGSSILALMMTLALIP